MPMGHVVRFVEGKTSRHVSFLHMIPNSEGLLGELKIAIFTPKVNFKVPYHHQIVVKCHKMRRSRSVLTRGVERYQIC